LRLPWSDDVDEAGRANGMVMSRTGARYLMEYTLLIPECTYLPSSTVALASMWLGKLGAGLEVWVCVSYLPLKPMFIKITFETPMLESRSSFR
jgi:hypothetical protein